MDGPMGPGGMYVEAPLPNLSIAEDHQHMWGKSGRCTKCGRKRKRKVKKSMDDVSKAITPGGRVGDASPFSTSRTSNWVARQGGLPKYIRMVAHALMRSGHSESKAIHMAIGIVENWASGKGHVSAKVRAAAAKAVAEFKAKAAKARVTKSEQTQWSLDDYVDITKQLEADGYIRKEPFSKALSRKQAD